MGFLCYLSEYLIPVLIFYILADGIFSGTSVYDEFVKGASEGVRTVFRIFPTLVGLMTAVGMLRASGVLDVLTKLLVLPARILHFPEQLIPLALVRLFSASAATSLVLDVYKQYGTDSYTGMLASIMMGCTETVFYTMSVYFLTVKISRTRWTLAGALFSTLAGIAASVGGDSIICTKIHSYYYKNVPIDVQIRT